MSDHLRHEDFVDALENTLDAARQKHVETCGECQAAIAKLRETLQDAKSVELPEPSPLFWDHFSDRVREATEHVPASTPWWQPQGWLRPVAIVATAAAAIALAIVLRPAPDTTPDSVSDVAAVVMPPDDGSWGLVIGLASEFDVEDVRAVATPRAGTADAMIAELTAAQRQALAQLLKNEIGDQ
jgi:anti-sigma-K factor RskA